MTEGGQRGRSLPEAGKRAGRSEGGPPAPNASPLALKVLVVDDNRFIVDLLRRYLAKLNITEPLEAEDGEAALRHLDAGGVDVVLCDLNMAGMDGIQFLRHLAARDGAPPVILLSGQSQSLLDTAVRLGRAHGLRILGAVTKPFSLASLKSLLDQVSTPTSAQRSSALTLLTPGDIRAGLQRDAVELVYQPKLSIRGGTLAGAEVFLRWRQPDGSLLYPASIVPVAESAGLITGITEAVLRKALAQCGVWRAEGYDFPLSVNVSMQDLARYDFPEFVIETAKSSGVEPASIMLEITESQIMTEITKPLEVVARLRLKGVGLSIDDYGTGASSMQQLRRIPFTELKIDREFVTGASHDRAARSMLTSSIALGKDLGLQVVAEGIETESEWRLVAARGADVGQGYYLARPMSADDMTRWLSSSAVSPSP